MRYHPRRKIGVSIERHLRRLGVELRRAYEYDTPFAVSATVAKGESVGNHDSALHLRIGGACAEFRLPAAPGTRVQATTVAHIPRSRARAGFRAKPPTSLSGASIANWRPPSRKSRRGHPRQSPSAIRSGGRSDRGSLIRQTYEPMETRRRYKPPFAAAAKAECRRLSGRVQASHGQRVSEMNEEARAAFSSVSTATVTTALLKRGLRNVWLAAPGRSIRALPVLSGGRSRCVCPGPRGSCDAQVAVVLEVHAVCYRGDSSGSVAVVSSCGIADAASSAILCARMVRRGVAGLITEGRFETWKAFAAPAFPSGAPAYSAPLFGRTANLCGLATADRLRRRSDLSRRHADRRPGWRHRDPKGDGARHSGEQPGNGGARGMDT